jgi:thiamine pyrophosphate-dependent acetolactate synthase large subunit-like protein
MTHPGSPIVDRSRDMSNTVNPICAVDKAVRAVAHAPQTIGIFAESSTAMFLVTQAVGDLGMSLHCRFSTHYGSMGHAIGGAVGFCSATAMRAIVVTGDGSFDFMNPMRTAAKHGLLLTMLVLNDSRLTMPFLGSGRAGAFHAQTTTQLEPWDFTRQGSTRIGGCRVYDLAALDGALAEALSADRCYVVDVQIDPTITAPVQARLDSVDALFGETLDLVA